MRSLATKNFYGLLHPVYSSIRLMETGSVTQANMKLSLVDGTAFIDIGTDISTDYAGADSGDHAYYIEVMDSAGKIAKGWIGAAGGGETLGAELVTNGDVESGLPDLDGYGNPTRCTAVQSADKAHAGSNSMKLTQNNGSPATFFFQLRDDDGDILPFGSLICAEAWVYEPDTNSGNALQLRGWDGDHTILLEGTTTQNAWVQLNGYFTGKTDPRIQVYGWDSSYADGDITYWDDISIKIVTDCHTNGVHIISTAGGSTQNWASIDADFDYNDASGYTYAIYAN